MSATICLYRIIPGVTYTGNIYDKVPFHHWLLEKNGDKKVEKYERSLGCPDWLTSPTETEEWIDSQFENRWSDGKEHKILDRYVFYRKREVRINRAYRRILKRLDNFNWSYYNTADGETKVYLPVEEVLYYQGWFFKDNFFKKKCTAHYCVTKEQIIHFFNQYVISTKDYDANFIRDMRETILNTWEDGMILEIMW